MWRVENSRDENDNPKFGIREWPEERYGEFYTGDSYILLQTRQKTTANDDTDADADAGSFMYDIYFWIGSESSQDEYGVAAYKANELDDLLDDAPVQHREVQYHESRDFLQCFDTNKPMRYLEGGMKSGFRNVDEASNDLIIPTRLFHVHRANRVTRCIQVPVSCDSLNHGDAFVLQCTSVVYTWFGDNTSPFEKNKAAEVAHNMVSASNGQATLVEEADDNDEEFWNEMGGKSEIKESSSESKLSEVLLVEEKTKIFILKDVDSILQVSECDDVSKDSLPTDDVCLIDTGKTIFVWIGIGSSIREQSQAMLLAQKHISSVGGQNKNIVRVKDGQESRISGFNNAFDN